MTDPATSTTRPAGNQPERGMEQRLKLDAALDRLAGLIQTPGGTAYLPLFEQLERELATAEAQDDALQRALNRARRAA